MPATQWRFALCFCFVSFFLFYAVAPTRRCSGHKMWKRFLLVCGFCWLDTTACWPHKLSNNNKKRVCVVCVCACVCVCVLVARHKGRLSATNHSGVLSVCSFATRTAAEHEILASGVLFVCSLATRTAAEHERFAGHKSRKVAWATCCYIFFRIYLYTSFYCLYIIVHTGGRSTVKIAVKNILDIFQ